MPAKALIKNLSPLNDYMRAAKMAGFIYQLKPLMIYRAANNF